MKKFSLIILFLFIIFGFISLVFFLKDSSNVSKINSFLECEANGFPIMESHPRQCRTSDGRLFVEEIKAPLDKSNLIVVQKPTPNSFVISPLEISGTARGTWFFEASFPVKIVSLTGEVLGVGHAQAQEEWMTENFVPFIANLEFDAGTFESGILILEKDNPSGLLENEDKIEIPVNFILPQE